MMHVGGNIYCLNDACQFSAEWCQNWVNLRPDKSVKCADCLPGPCVHF